MQSKSLPCCRRDLQPYGLGYEIEAIEGVIRERKSAEAMAAAAEKAPLATHGGEREGAGRPAVAEKEKEAAIAPDIAAVDQEQEEGIQGDIVTLNSDRGNRAQYLTARIARDRPDILDRMKAGEFQSVRQAALTAGVVKKKIQIEVEPEAAARLIRKHFTPEQVVSGGGHKDGGG